jgi:hypothetical protein
MTSLPATASWIAHEIIHMDGMDDGRALRADRQLGPGTDGVKRLDSTPTASCTRSWEDLAFLRFGPETPTTAR